MPLHDLLPTRADYDLRPRVFGADLLAGVTVGVVALPLALAFGVSSGVGAAAGLVTAIVAGIVAALFGGSNFQVSGPTGAMAVVLAPIVADHGLGSVALVTVLGGLIVLAAGALRLGRLVTIIPWPVVEGFTLGIACIIFLQQVPAGVGETVAPGGNTAVAALRAIQSAEPHLAWWTTGTVAVVAAIMLILGRFAKAVPASLIAVALVTLLAEVFDNPLARIGTLPHALPLPVLPSASAGALRELGGAALAVAALAVIESLLSARVAAGMTDRGSVYQPDRELVGQGLASIASGLFGGMPATGAIARTAVNVRSGAHTRMAAIVHALVILGVLYLATGPVSRIPLAALSGVLMVTATRMIPLRTVRQVVRASRSSAAAFGATALVTIAFDLIDAVEIGILVAAFFALRALARASSIHREPLPGPAEPGDEHIALYRLEGAMFFGAADRVLAQVLADSKADEIRVVVLRLSGLQMVDATGAKALADLVAGLERSKVTVMVKGMQPGHLGIMRTVGVLDELAHERHLFDELPDAVAHARDHIVRPYRSKPPGVST